MAVVNHPNPPHNWRDGDGNVDWDAYEGIIKEANFSMTARTWFPGDDDGPVESRGESRQSLMRRQIAAIRRLHQQYRPAFEHPDVCSHCTRGMDLVDWPCPTIKALDNPT